MQLLRQYRYSTNDNGSKLAYSVDGDCRYPINTAVNVFDVSYFYAGVSKRYINSSHNFAQPVSAMLV